MASRFLKMGLQGVLELGLGCRLDHFRQCISDLGFGGMELLQLVKVKLPEAI
jgi:hypothetical protein